MVLQWAICRLLAVIVYLYQIRMKYAFGCVRLTMHVLFRTMGLQAKAILTDLDLE